MIFTLFNSGLFLHLARNFRVIFLRFLIFQYFFFLFWKFCKKKIINAYFSFHATRGSSKTIFAFTFSRNFFKWKTHSKLYFFLPPPLHLGMENNHKLQYALNFGHSVWKSPHKSHLIFGFFHQCLSYIASGNTFWPVLAVLLNFWPLKCKRISLRSQC